MYVVTNRSCNVRRLDDVSKSGVLRKAQQDGDYICENTYKYHFYDSTVKENVVEQSNDKVSSLFLCRGLVVQLAR